MMIINKNYKMIVAGIFLINIIILLFSVYQLTQCDGFSGKDCLLRKEGLFPDFYWQYNTIDKISENGKFPYEVNWGGFTGEEGKIIKMWNSPLYYYLGGMVLFIAKMFGSDGIILLHSFSVFLTAITLILFYFLLKKLSKYFRSKKFIVYGFGIFAFMPTHLFMSIPIHNDVLYGLFIALVLLTGMIFFENKNYFNAVILGIVVGIAILARMSSLIFLLAVFLCVVIFHFIDKDVRNKLIVSGIIGGLIGSYVFIRNYVVFGGFFALNIAERHEASILKLVHLMRAFWGGIWGGVGEFKIIIMIIAIVLVITMIWGMLIAKRLNKKEINYFLYFILGIFLFTIILNLNWSCSLVQLILKGKCMSIIASQNRYLMPIEFIIAIFSGVALTRIEKKARWIVPLFVLFLMLMFGIDFLYAIMKSYVLVT